MFTFLVGAFGLAAAVVITVIFFIVVIASRFSNKD